MKIWNLVILGLFACGEETRDCNFSVWFDSEAVIEPGEQAISRIRYATGCRIDQLRTGTHISSVAHLEDAEGPLCGATDLGKNTTVISEDCPDLDNIIAHELFHVMIQESDNSVHSETGVFKLSTGNLIDESTLSLVCSYVDCPTLNPETKPQE